ncbi:MAG: hypothetical protein ABJB16_02930 [Saprospiraceae bacterium]
MTLIICLFACSSQSDNEKVLQNRIDDLEVKLKDTYKPGLGDFMSGIQAHHAKLWFSGENQNWKLADFEIHEIMEALDDIKKYQGDRKETEKIGMINPALDSVNMAIKENSPALFKSSYTLLTNTCNNCHHAVGFEFNVVKIPEAQQFSNQDFKVRK